jgi:hypothetical protein
MMPPPYSTQNQAGYMYQTPNAAQGGSYPYQQQQGNIGNSAQQPANLPYQPEDGLYPHQQLGGSNNPG